MLRFLDEGIQGKWAESVAEDHDAALADSYRAPNKRRR